MEIPAKTKLKTQPVPLELVYQGETYRGLAVPVSKTCSQEVCWELEVTLNNEQLGRIHCTQRGWKMDYVRDQGLVNAIGERISLWYE